MLRIKEWLVDHVLVPVYIVIAWIIMLILALYIKITVTKKKYGKNRKYK